MNTTYIIIVAVLVLMVPGGILAPIFARRRRTERFENQFESEYDRTVGTAGSEKQAQAELDGRRKHVDSLNIRPLSVDKRQHYQAERTEIQAKFVDQQGQANLEADHLITEVMKIREYPASNFEEREADISIEYPTLVSSYRAACEIVVKNEQNEADTEGLRKSTSYYRSLFDELLKAEAVGAEKG